MEMSVSSEMTFFTTKQQLEICPQLRTQSSAEDRGRIDTRYVLPISAPQTFMLFSLARNMDSLRDLVQTTSEQMLSIGSGVR